MKQSQTGSAHVLIIGIIIVLLLGVLGYVLFKNLTKEEGQPAQQQSGQSIETPDASSYTLYAEFDEWKVRFPTNTEYTLTRNSGTGVMSMYYVSIDSLAETCANPDTPWLGMLHQFPPKGTIATGPSAGKTFAEIYADEGIGINGMLYVFKARPQACLRNTENEAVIKAAEKLKNEMKLLEAY